MFLGGLAACNSTPDPFPRDDLQAGVPEAYGRLKRSSKGSGSPGVPRMTERLASEVASIRPEAFPGAPQLPPL